MMSLASCLEQFLQSDAKHHIEHVEVIPETSGHYRDLPTDLAQPLVDALTKRGITTLYSHQKEAYDYAMNGQSFTAVTPTASGKSLCYHLPVLQTILQNPNSRALYLFPTKALAQDQKMLSTN